MDAGGEALREEAVELSALLRDFEGSEAHEQLVRDWAKTFPGLDLERGDPGLTYRPPVGERPRDFVSASLPTLTIAGDGESQAPVAELDPNEAEPLFAQEFPGGPPEARYEIVSELAKGGMGAVYSARQRSLQREIAIKKMLAGPADSSLRRHFVAEALITGLLDHPNIVPVHDLGMSPKGELLLAMKLVGGVEWKHLLHPRTEAEEERARDTTLKDHLGILLNVCNAMAFAHSRGIVHLDLKPANIMIGEFGEVLVMDWGLALSIHEESETAPLIRDRSAMAGPAGTPAYMAPELAEGRGADVGPWTDVYLLGAILYEICNGHPPHRGKQLSQVLLAACESRAPDFPDAVPRELQEICRRATARVPSDRYESVLELRQALQSHLAHRESTRISDEAARIAEGCQERLGQASGPLANESARSELYTSFNEALAAFRQARFLWPGNEDAVEGEERVRLSYARAAIDHGHLGIAETQLGALDNELEQARSLRSTLSAAQERQSRAQQTTRRLRRGLLVALASTFVILISGLVYYLETNRRLELQKQAILEQKNRVAEERDKASRERDRARASAEIAQEALHQSVIETRDVLGDFRSKRIREARQKLLLSALSRLEKLQGLESDADENLSFLSASAYTQTGRLALEIGEFERAKKAFDTALALARETLARNPENGAARHNLVLALIDHGDSQEQAEGAEALKSYEEALGLARSLVEDDPDNRVYILALSRALGMTATLLCDLGRFDRALVLGHEAVDTMRRALKMDPTQLVVYSDLASQIYIVGNIYHQQRRLKEALVEYRQGLKISRELVALDPEYDPGQESLMLRLASVGHTLQQLGQVSEGLELLEEAVSICRRLIARDPLNYKARFNLIAFLKNLQEALYNKGLIKRALAVCEEGVRLQRRQVSDDPKDRSALYKLATWLECLGGTHAQLDQTDASESAFEESLVLLGQLISVEPSSIKYRSSHTRVRNSLLKLRRRGGRSNGTDWIQGLRESVTASRDLVRQHPKSFWARNDLAIALLTLATALAERGVRAETIQLHEEAERILAGLSEEDHSDHAIQYRQMKLYRLRGDLLKDEGEIERARRYYRRALDLGRSLLERDGNNQASLSAASIVLNRLGDLANNRGELEAALGHYLEGVEIGRRLVAREGAYYDGNMRNLNIGLGKAAAILKRKKQWDKALELLRQRLAFSQLIADRNPDDSISRRNGGITHVEISDILVVQRKWGFAKEQLAKGLERHLQLARRNPTSLWCRKDLFVTLMKNYQFSLDRQDSQAALRFLRRSLAQLLILIRRSAVTRRSEYMRHMSQLEADRTQLLAFFAQRGVSVEISPYDELVSAYRLLGAGEYLASAQHFQKAFENEDLQQDPNHLQPGVEAAAQAAKLSMDPMMSEDDWRRLGIVWLGRLMESVREDLADIKRKLSLTMESPERQSLESLQTEVLAYVTSLREKNPRLQPLRDSEDFKKLFEGLR